MTELRRRGIEARADERSEGFSLDFSLLLVANEDESFKVPIRPLDVSRRGLGFIAKQELKSGRYFWLHIGDDRFRTELAYCTNYLGIDGLYRCGLFLREADGDLVATCRKSGLLEG